MSTITVILKPDADGSVRIPLPPELRHGRVRVEAKLEAVGETADGGPQALADMLLERKEALAALRALGGLRDVIPDPVAWQRELREERPLPGRE